ncbi:MAG: cytochrome c biogenesis protein CcsA [Candidatus Zixiibacteriota bacterium]
MVSGQPGDLAIYLALGMTILAGLAFFATALGKRNLFNLGSKAYYLYLVFIAGASAYLYYLFFSHDFSIEYVYSYSSSDLPFFYLLSAFWGGQEGTYLLWALLSGLFGLIILYNGGRYKTWGMFFYSLINLFLVVMMLTLSPFERMPSVMTEGAGLNPLLQDPWMVIHPPIMFVAYAMAGVPFALVLAAMIRKDYAEWLKISFPYVVITSLSLAVANVLGGYWAYKTLGWGGYWAWDPVENTSFVPWVVSLGLIHSMLIEKRIGALRRTNLLLSIFIVLLVIYGTCLTRSGVLADFSVHSFVDLGANAVLISFVVFYLVLTLAMFIFSRGREISGKPLNYNLLARDFILFVGMILLVALGVVILFWSSLPLITQYVSDNPTAAEISTYNTFAFPFAILISLFVTVSPFIKGLGEKIEGLNVRVLTGIAVALVVSAILWLAELINLTIAITLLIYIAAIFIYLRFPEIRKNLIISLAIGFGGLIIALLFGVRNIEYLFFIAAAAAGAGAHIIVLSKQIPGNLAGAGGYLTHFGFAMMLMGILASSAFSSNYNLVLPRSQAKSAYDIDVTYQGMSGSIADQKNEILLALSHDGKTTEARPQYFYTRRMDGIMKRPYIRKNLTYDLYFSPQEVQEIPGGHGLMLRKGQSQSVGDYTIKFVDFEVASHEGSAGMSVGAWLEVSSGGKTETVVPVLRSDASGTKMISDPINLFSNSDYKIKLDKIFADQGTVSLSIPGLVEAGPRDKLILDVSKKPGINLLWLGTIIVFIGMFLSARKRFRQSM